MDDEDGFSRVEPPWPDTASVGSFAPDRRELLTISEVEREFGLTQRALRFYEAKGLLSPQRAGSVRLYSRTERARLAQIVRAKRLGFTLCEIRQMLDESSASAGEGTLSMSRRQCFEQIKHLEQRKREIEAALAELRTIYSSFYVRLAAGTF
jgi:DNA-binding transcriptional MerR regulator